MPLFKVYLETIFCGESCMSTSDVLVHAWRAFEMSMELYVLSERRLESIEAWQESLDNDRHPLRLSAERPLADVKGAVPVWLQGHATSFECDHWNKLDLIRTYPDMDFSNFAHVLAFRWGADVNAGMAAYMAASSYARATGGAIFDCQEGRFISPQRASIIASEIERNRAQIDAAVQHVLQKFRN